MPSSPVRSWVYLPVQTKVREFVAKTFLSCVLAEAGLGAVLITHRRFRPIALQLPPGVVGDYSVTRPFLPSFANYTGHGHAVAGWEEEGLAAIPSDAIAGTDRFFAWGATEAARAIAANPAVADRVRITGNPRADLLRTELASLHKGESDRLRAEHGQFILVNGNFSANVMYGEEELQAQWRLEHANFTPELEEYYKARWAHSRQLFLSFTTMVPALAGRFPEKTVIVRPHPSEDVDAWRRAMAPHANVKVILQGNVLNWIQAASALVHNSCTTGIESAVMGRPTFAYRPVVNASQDWDLANDVSVTAKDLDSLLELVAAAFANEAPTPTSTAHSILADHVAALDGPFAAERMAEEFVALARPSARLPSALGARAAAGSAWYDMKHTVKLKLGQTATPLSFEKQKNPGWSQEEVDGIVRGLRDATGRFEGVLTGQFGHGLTALWAK